MKIGENGVNSKESLIDFQQKKIDSEPQETKKEYENQRKKFYDDKKKELEEREKEIIEKKVNETSFQKTTIDKLDKIEQISNLILLLVSDILNTQVKNKFFVY